MHAISLVDQQDGFNGKNAMESAWRYVLELQRSTKKHYFVPVKQVVSKLRKNDYFPKGLVYQVNNVLRGEMLIYQIDN